MGVLFRSRIPKQNPLLSCKSVWNATCKCKPKRSRTWPNLVRARLQSMVCTRQTWPRTAGRAERCSITTWQTAVLASSLIARPKPAFRTLNQTFETTLTESKTKLTCPSVPF